MCKRKHNKTHAKNRINESNQGIESKNLQLKESNQRIESRNRMKEANQLIESITSDT